MPEAVPFTEPDLAYWNALKAVMTEHSVENNPGSGDSGFKVLAITASLLGAMAAAARGPEVAIQTVIGNVQMGFNQQMAHNASKDRPPSSKSPKPEPEAKEGEERFTDFTPDIEAAFMGLWHHLIAVGRKFDDDTLALALAGKLCGCAIRCSDDVPGAKDVVMTNMEMECATRN